MKIPKALIPSRTAHVWQRPASCDPACGCVRRVCRLCGVEGMAERTVEGLLSSWVRTVNGRTRMTDCSNAAEAVAAIVATIAEELSAKAYVEAVQFGDAAGHVAWVEEPGCKARVACEHDHAPNDRGERAALKCAKKSARVDDRARLKRDRESIKRRIRATIEGDAAPAKAAP